MAMNGNGLRRLLKTGFALGAHWSQLDRLIGSQRGYDQAPLVLGYHRVVRNFEESARHAMPSMLVSLDTLEKHLDWVAQRYRFVTLDEVARWYANGRNRVSGRGPGRGRAQGGDKPLAAVTFDDGYLDVYENAFPLLQAKGIPFTAYVVTDLVGTDRLQLHDELYLLLSEVLRQEKAARQAIWQSVIEGYDTEPTRFQRLFQRVDDSGSPYLATRLMLHGLGGVEVRQALWVLQSHARVDDAIRRELQSMDWDMLRDLTRNGCTVGSHTRSHTLLGTASRAVMKVELEGSRRDLERQLQTPIRHLAYPDGSYNASALEAVRAAGYETACTTDSRAQPSAPTLTLPRRMLWEGACMDSLGQFSPAILSCQVNGVFDVLAAPSLGGEQ